MRNRIYHGLILSLSSLQQLSPNQQLIWLLAALLFLIVANVASNAITEAVDLPPWLSLLLLPLLVLLVAAWYILRDRPDPGTPPAPVVGAPPPPYKGMILMLGLFNSRGDKQVPGFAGASWRQDEMQTALERIDRGEHLWPLVIERFEKSNMQPALEAIRHHGQRDTLTHIWLITTADVKDPEGKVIQRGSYHFAPLFRRIINEGIGFDAKIEYEDNRLLVSAEDVKTTYEAVTYVYEVLSQQRGLVEEEIIADITGGRALMTAGMVLACGPCGRALQYTSTTRDPAKGGAVDTPIPRIIDVNPADIQLCTLRAITREREL